MAVYFLDPICKDHRTQVMALHGADLIRANIVAGRSHPKQVTAVLNTPYNVPYNVPYIINNTVVKTLHKFKHMCGTIRKTLKPTSKETRMMFYKEVTLPTFLCGSGL